MRSDWEEEIADYIEEEYPELEVEFNCRDIVPSRNSSRNLELDVYIPELKLAFELNGESYHDHEQYKLDKEFGTCVSDEMYKKQYCEEHGIKLVHIWSSKDEESIEDKIDKHIKKQKKKLKKKHSMAKNNRRNQGSIMNQMVSANLKILVNDAAAVSTAKASVLEMEMFLGKSRSDSELKTAALEAFDAFKQMGHSEEEARNLAYAVSYGAQERRTSMLNGMLNACQQLNANKDK